MTQAVPHDEDAGDAAQRLESWKEIASYLRRGVRTVQRWEQTEGLPIRRHHHDKRGTVYAFRHEIDAWRETRSEAEGAAATALPARGPAPVHGDNPTAENHEPEAASGARWISALRKMIPTGRKPRLAIGVTAVLILLMWS